MSPRSATRHLRVFELYFNSSAYLLAFLCTVLKQCCFGPPPLPFFFFILFINIVELANRVNFSLTE